MNERAPSFCLPPLINTKAGVIERNAIGIQTFAVGSVYPNKLRREVQHLTEFFLTFPKRIDQLLMLCDIHPRADELLQARIATRDAHATYMADAAVTSHDSFRKVEAGPACKHLLNFVLDEFPIFRMYQGQIFFFCWRVASRIESVDLKQLRRPI